MNRDGDLDLNWYLPAPSVGEYDYSLLLHQSDKALTNDFKYKEVDGSYYSYGLIDFDQSLLDKYVFRTSQVSVDDKKSI